MKKVIINEKEKGLLFKNGKYVKMLGAGKYNLTKGKEIEVFLIDEEIYLKNCSIDIILLDEKVKENTEVVEVKDEELVVRFVNGNYKGVLSSGKHAFFKGEKKHTFISVDISTPNVDESFPKYLFSKIPTTYFYKFEVNEYQKGRLYFDKKLITLLDSGTYYFWKNNIKVEVGLVDARLLQMDIVGQEILTLDKVSLRINFVCNYKIVDFIKIINEIDNFSEQLRISAQLALREYVGKYRLDEILENKEQMTKYVFDALKNKEKDLFIEVVDAGVKDIILPGEIREIMNTVLIAEKKAQANVISRREEVASTRSLLNTAKLMDENKTLYKLKELEYIERICENVGHITLNGSGDILTQLSTILKKGD